MRRRVAGNPVAVPPCIARFGLKLVDTNGFLTRKLVIIGDGACGKTSLLSVFTLGYFPTVSGVDSLVSRLLRLTSGFPAALCESMTQSY
jgi:GTPase SAR1 family protein